MGPGHMKSALLQIAINLAFQELHNDVDCNMFNSDATVDLGLLRKYTEPTLSAFK